MRRMTRIVVVTLAAALLLAVPSRGFGADGRKALVLVLHAYGMTGLWTTTYFRLGALADRVVVLAPNGSRDASGKRAWNASLACCNPSGPDDVGSLSRLVEARIAQGDIDPTRVYVWGYSNGAFMAWRLACARADLFRAIVMVGGSVGAASDPRCIPSQPFDVLLVHGTSDTTVKYRTNELVDGMIEPYFGVVSGSLQQAAEALACTEPAIAAEYRAFDHDALVSERETDRYLYRGCLGRVEHWQMMGSKHIPSLTESWPFDLLTWCDQRP